MAQLLLDQNSCNFRSCVHFSASSEHSILALCQFSWNYSKRMIAACGRSTALLVSFESSGNWPQLSLRTLQMSLEARSLWAQSWTIIRLCSMLPCHYGDGHHECQANFRFGHEPQYEHALLHCCTLKPEPSGRWQTETPVAMGISIYIFLEPYSRMQECKRALTHTHALLTALFAYIAASITSGSITGSSANCSLVPQYQWCPIFRT
jgi:hypothetical protein